jgi:H+/Cl- antiporter ClcA
MSERYKRTIHAGKRLLMPHRWVQRAVLWGGAISVGIVATLFALAGDFANSQFHALQSEYRWAPLLITPLGLAAVAWITRRFCPGAVGSGIPQTIAAINERDERFRNGMLSLRIAVSKIVLTFIALLSGASVGREGPTVQVGASIMHAIGERFRFSRRDKEGGVMIVAGGAAGVAAAFNTPLAGIVFAIEELSRSYEYRTSGITLTAVVLAGITAVAIVGNYTYFGVTNVALGGGGNLFAIPVCGLTGGIAGGVFARLLIGAGHGIPGQMGLFGRRHPIYFAAACGLVLAIIGIIAGGSTFGTGYEQAKGLLQNSQALPDSYPVLKLAATLISYVSGIPGGVFAPSLAVGAGLGGELAQFFPLAPPSTIVVLGMVAYFSGVVQAPLTAFVIVLEMTNDQDMVLPLMATALIARFASRIVCPEPLYRALADSILAARGAPAAKEPS